MLYMIIERFHPNKIKELYERFDKKGRLMPKGLEYVNSWTDEKVEMCFQIIECESEDALQKWIDNWKDLADFEIIPVLTSAQAKEKVLSN